MLKVLVIENDLEVATQLRVILDHYPAFDVHVEPELGPALELLWQDPDFELILCSYTDELKESLEKFSEVRASRSTIFLCPPGMDPEDRQSARVERTSDLEADMERSRRLYLVQFIDRSRFQIEIPAAIEFFIASRTYEPLGLLDLDYVRLSHGLLSTIAPVDFAIHRRSMDGRYSEVDSAVLLVSGSEPSTVYYVNRRECPQLLSKILADLDVKLTGAKSSEVPAREVGVDTLDLVQDLVFKIGFTPEVQEVAKKAASLVVKIVGTDPQLSQILDRLNLNQGRYLASHSLMLAEIACAMCYQIGWVSSGTYLKLSLAALMHDIALHDNALARVRDIKDPRVITHWTPVQLEEVRQHPIRAAHWASQFTDIPQEVDSIVVQHHENADGTGFPRGLFHNHISPLSSLFIIAHDLLDGFLAQGTGPGADLISFLDETEERYSKGTFRKIVRALKTNTHYK